MKCTARDRGRQPRLPAASLDNSYLNVASSLCYVCTAFSCCSGRLPVAAESVRERGRRLERCGSLPDEDGTSTTYNTCRRFV